MTTLRRKILVGYGIALALLAIVLAWSVRELVELGRASEAILVENYRSVEAADSMIRALGDQKAGALLLRLGRREEGISLLTSGEAAFLQALTRAKDNVTIEGEGDVVLAIDRSYATLLQDLSRLREETRASPPAGGPSEEIEARFSEVRDAAGRLRETNQKTMFAASARASRVARRAILSLVGVGGLALAVGLVFSLLLSKRLVKPLHEMIDATREIAAGSYDVRIPASSSDEIGQLAEEFNAMARRMKTYHDLNIERIVAEERKNEAVLQSIDDALFVVDAELRVVNVNRAAAKLLEIPATGVLGKHFLEVVPSEELLGYVRRTLETGEPPEIPEEKRVVTTGSGDAERHHLLSISAFRGESGPGLGVVLHLRDVTRMRELDRAKSEFIMTASHELRTPLASALMSVDLLRERLDEGAGEDERQLLGAAHEELSRLRALVDDLLDLSRIEAGRIDLDFSPVSVEMLFEKTLSVFREQAEAKGVDLSVRLAEDVPEVRADPEKIAWVLVNLVSNALRYVRRDGRIALGAERVGERVHVSVRDDGKGIPPEYQSRIFDKFVQVKGDPSTGGTGLGLAICREVVRAHRGTIWVDSAPGEGSTFTFTLPLARTSEGALP